MRAVRPVLALTLVASLSAAGVASAVTKPKPKPVKPVCHLVTDATGDASPQSPLPSDDTLDITSADIATNATTLTVVVRVLNLGATSVPQHTGVSYEVNFALPSAANQLFLSYASDDSGAHSEFGDIETLAGQGNYTPKGTATTVVDKAKNEIRISAKLSDLSALGKFTPGVKITGIDAKTSQLIGTPQATPDVPGVIGPGNGLLNPVDDAPGSLKYVIGTPSCVPVGK